MNEETPRTATSCEVEPPHEIPENQQKGDVHTAVPVEEVTLEVPTEEPKKAEIGAAPQPPTDIEDVAELCNVSSSDDIMYETLGALVTRWKNKKRGIESPKDSTPMKRKGRKAEAAEKNTCRELDLTPRKKKSNTPTRVLCYDAHLPKTRACRKM